MAVIELDLTAQPDQPLSARPPASRYRLPGLLLAAVLAIAIGGAAPARPTLFRLLGTIPAPAGTDTPFRLGGGRLYVVTSSGTDRLTSAYAPQRPPRRLWTARFPAWVPGPDAVPVGGVQARQVRDVVLVYDGPATTALDARTGKIRWNSEVTVTPLAGGRIGVQHTQVFRPGTLYDQDSGRPGLLYFSSTGEPHVEPPVRTELHGIDLASGRTIWTAALPGSVNIFEAPGAVPAVLVLASDRLERLAGDTGAIVRQVALPRVGGATPAAGELIGDLVVVDYGDYTLIGHESAFAAGTLDRRWERTRPDMQLDPHTCSGVLCSGPRATLEVLDPATGQAAWRTRGGVDLARRGGYVMELDTETGLPQRLVDPATGTLRVPLAGWGTEISGDDAGPLVLRKPEPEGRSVFGVVLADRDRVQLLGQTSGALSDCTADRALVVCRGDDRLRVWAYGG